MARAKYEIIAEDKTKAAFDSVKRGFGDISNSASSMKGVLAGAFTAIGTGALAAFAKQSLDVADSIDKASKRAGVAAQTLQELRFAVDQLGGSQQSLDDGLKKLTIGLGEFATAGSGPAAAALKALNIEVRDSAGNVRGTESVFGEVVRKLESVESQAQRSALAAKLFGESAGPDLELLLREGVGGIDRLRESARDIGAVISDDIIANAVTAKDELAKVSSVLSVQFTSALLEVAPLLTSFAEGALIAAQNVGAFFDSFKPLAERGNLRGLSEELDSVNKAINAYAGQIFRIEAAGGNAEGPRRIVEGLREEREALMARIGLVEQLKEQQKAAGKTADDLGTAFQGLAKETKKLSEAEKAALREQADYQKRLQTLIDILDPVGKETADYMQAVEDLDAAWAKGLLSGEEYDRLMMALATDTEAVTTAAEEATKAQEKAAEERKKLAEKEAEAMQRPFEHAAEGIQDALTDGLEGALNGTLRKASDVFDELKRIGIRAAAEVASAWFIRPVIAGTGLFGASAASASTAGAQLAGGGGGGGGLSLDSITSIFSSGRIGGVGSTFGDLSFGNVAGNIGAGLLGNAAGGFLADKWGGGKSGGNVGSVVGGAIGSIWGPVGSFVGSALGKFAGSFFGAEPSDKAQGGRIDLATGRIIGLEGQTGKKFSQENADFRTQVLEQAGQLATALAEITGGTLTEQLKVVIGSRDGLRYQFGSGPLQNAGSSPEALLAGITQGMLSNLQGVDDQFRQVFAQIDFRNLEAAVQDLAIAGSIINKDYVQAEPLNAAAQAIKDINEAFAPFIENAKRFGLSLAPINAELNKQIGLLKSGFTDSIADAILGYTDPLALALKNFETVAEERLANARALGVSLVEVERLNGIERTQIIEQHNAQANAALTAANQSIEQFLTGMRSGSGSFLSPQAVLANAEAEFERLVSAAQGGDVDARAGLTGAAGNLRSASREVFGSSAMFFEREGFIERTLSNLVNQASQTTSFDNIGAAIAQGNAENSYWNSRVVDRLDRLTQVVEDQQAVLSRLVSA